MPSIAAQWGYTILALMGLSRPSIYAASLSVDERSTTRDGDVKNAYGDCPIARTCQGLVRGTHLNEDVNAFLGIPYAQAPVGDLRFRPPQPLPTAAGEEKEIVEASDFGPVCYQFHYRTVLLNNTIETTPQSEDCLSLNIFVPRKASNSKLLPTLFWSYGGGFAEGGGSMPVFDPRGLVASQGDMIVVTFNYRGTIFGFPNSPALPIDQQNLGIRDHRAALEWLRDNLASFGGDPTQITVGGQSSGADSWAALAYTHPDNYIARGLLLESGQPLAAEPSGDPSEEFHRIAGIVGCRNKTDNKAELRCMSTVPADTLRGAISDKFLNPFAVPNGGTPMVDNITLLTPGEYLKRGNSGKFAKVPVFMGMNDQEVDAVLNWSPKCGINKTLSNLFTFSFFECPLTLEASYRSTHDVPIWRYRYFGRFSSDTFFSWLGPYHAAEVPYILGSYTDLKPHREVHPNEHAAAKMLQDAVSAFVRDPQAGLTMDMGWPMYHANKTTLVELFHDNKPTYELADPAKYYSGCDNLPPVPWQEVAKPPPTC